MHDLRTRSGAPRKHDPQAILRYIIRYKMEHDGISPTIRQIGMACDIDSTSNIVTILKWLERTGEIQILRSPEGVQRGLMVTGGRWSRSEVAG